MSRINTDQTIVVSIDPKTASGNSANIDGDATFRAVNSTGATTGSFEQLSPTSARFTPTQTGAIQIKVSADADLDEGEVRTLQASGALEVVTPEEEATTLSVTFGEPE